MIDFDNVDLNRSILDNSLGSTESMIEQGVQTTDLSASAAGSLNPEDKHSDQGKNSEIKAIMVKSSDDSTQGYTHHLSLYVMDKTERIDWAYRRPLSRNKKNGMAIELPTLTTVSPVGDEPSIRACPVAIRDDKDGACPDTSRSPVTVEHAGAGVETVFLEKSHGQGSTETLVDTSWPPILVKLHTSYRSRRRDSISHTNCES